MIIIVTTTINTTTITNCNYHYHNSINTNKTIFSARLIPQKSFVTLELDVTDCPGVNYLEHVQAKVSASENQVMLGGRILQGYFRD